MSYQVLARKWRPQTFLEMAGQDHVLQALVNALRQQRLHHAYLFTGTRGVGKTTIARIFAKCLNCETNGISPEPCGTCDSCREIAEGRFVDLIEVDAASRTKVEDTRELLENVQYAPTRGRFKVYLIDEVHMLSTHSFNALLKTLEEPPAHVKFLLATTDPQKLPVTVLSRCLQFNLKNMSPQRVVDYLQTVLKTEQVSFDQPALWQIGQAANGSMRDALSLTDQAIAFGNGTISESGVTAMLGLVNQSQVLDLLESVVAKNAAEVLSRIESLADYQPDYAAICGSLLDVLHRVAIEQQVPGALVDQLGDLSRIQAMAASIHPEEVQVMYQSLLIGRRDLPLSHSARAGFEMLMLRLIAFRPTPPMTVTNQEAEPRVEAEKKTVEPETTPTLTAPVSVSAPDPEIIPPPVPAAEPSVSPVAESTPMSQIEDADTHDAADARDAADAMESKASERPPWEDAPIESRQPDTHISESPVVNASPLVDNSIDEADDEDVDEEEAEEQAIAEVSNPFNPAADLVNALGSTTESALSESYQDSEEVTQNQSVIESRLSKVPDTVAQPALGMAMPNLTHFRELTMQHWWLVAPRLGLTGLVQNIVMNSSLVDASDQGIRLQVPLEYGHMLNQTRYEQIQSVLSDFFAVAVPLIIDTVEDTSGVTAEEFAASKRAEALQVAIQHLNSHPVVQALSTTMGAQLVYDTVKVKA
ncbi:DNA polymerase III subunit gamma/tau [Marinomonas algarum]|uniref:DNA polymerase III subunit gamma/tau n=1 Tax=Marinomonas algarum TaxID=2883105 RepID=A0A9X1LEY3_9GAMM|nr:DNA polymerase III subunit gamma/tau [Marinomonas algarum]MCB5162193.1 DNA polymerase III subunit gamma/tau [Marinomonas algarum]